MEVPARMPWTTDVRRLRCMLAALLYELGYIVRSCPECHGSTAKSYGCKHCGGWGYLAEEERPEKGAK